MTCRYHVADYLAPSEADCAAYKARTGQDRPSLAVRLQDLTPEVASRHLALLLERGRRDGGGLRPRTVRGVRITLNTALASLAAMWVLLVTSGMRPSEVLGVPWPAVDLEAGVVSIYQKLVKDGTIKRTVAPELLLINKPGFVDAINRFDHKSVIDAAKACAGV